VPGAEWQAYTAKLRSFSKRPPRGAVRFGDVPWLEEPLLSRNRALADFKELSLFWHPDKFVQRFGGSLAPTDKERILKRVTEVAALVLRMR